VDDLTSAERRLVLGAMWRLRDSTAADLTAAGAGWTEDVDQRESVETLDSAARKLGGHPEEYLYGGPRY
jgi:hypothetical protein